MGKNWRFHGVGVIVRDIDKAIEYYKSLGIATVESEVTEIKLDKHAYPDLKIYGKPPDSEIIVKIVALRVGSIVFELVQPVKGKTVHSEFLESKGEGVQFITFIVDDFDKEVAGLVDNGIPVLLSGKAPTGEGFAHFDTSKMGGVVLELYRPGE